MPIADRCVLTRSTDLRQKSVGQLVIVEPGDCLERRGGLSEQDLAHRRDERGVEVDEDPILVVGLRCHCLGGMVQGKSVIALEQSLARACVREDPDRGVRNVRSLIVGGEGGLGT
jgi:hypothetical protein